MNLLRNFKVELLAILAILLGIFLVFEKFEIRATLISVLRQSIKAIQSGLSFLVEGVKNFLGKFELSDAVGLILIISMGILIIWRIRYRFARSQRWLEITCPKCDSRIYRSHRSRTDRFIGFTILPDARRYKCSDSSCDWSGLRRKGRRREYKEKHGNN